MSKIRRWYQLLLIMLTTTRTFHVANAFDQQNRYDCIPRWYSSPVGALSSARQDDDEFETHHLSRRSFLAAEIMSSAAVGSLIAAALLPKRAMAEEDTTTSSRTIHTCRKDLSGKPTNCVSTRNGKQVDLYVAPWTYDGETEPLSNPSNVMSRLQDALESISDETFDIIEQDSLFLRVQTKRITVGGSVTDEIEFLIQPSDNVVTLSSRQLVDDNGLSPIVVSDFGANKSRLEKIRQAAGCFGRMGQGMDTADTVINNGNGPLGQLKAFYGLQSGAGYEDVFAED